jgi:hypothetical protein
VGNVGINTTNPLAMLHVKDSSVLFTANIGGSPGNTPVTGAGVRMMWYADKAAFRSGRVQSNQWNADSIGYYSVASGFDVKATNIFSAAFGNSTIASGFASSALGSFTRASGNNSMAVGEGTLANGYGSLVAGMFNDPIVGAQTSVTSTTPLFIIGKGDAGNPSNAVVVRKNGFVGIGTNNPGDLLHIMRSTSGASPNTNASLILEDAGNNYIHFLSGTGSETGVIHGRPASSIRGGIIFDNQSNIRFRTGGNINRMNIDSVGSVAINTPVADASAILEVNSTSKGVLLPRMTTSQREAITSPANGLLTYDNTTNSFWYNRNGNWTEINNQFRQMYVIKSTGAQNFSVPSGVNLVYIEMWAAGGAGKSTTVSDLGGLVFHSTGGGGGAGSYAAFYLDVSAGGTISFSIPAGSTGSGTTNLSCTYGAKVLTIESGSDATTSAPGTGGDAVITATGFASTEYLFIPGGNGRNILNHHEFSTYAGFGAISYDIHYGDGGSPAYFNTGGTGGQRTVFIANNQPAVFSGSVTEKLAVQPAGGGAAPRNDTPGTTVNENGAAGMVIIRY